MSDHGVSIPPAGRAVLNDPTRSKGTAFDSAERQALDVGANNSELLDDPLHLGWRHERITGADYDDFVEQFVTELFRRHSRVQWEDFAGHHATPLLHHCRDRVLSFNDDTCRPWVRCTR